MLKKMILAFFVAASVANAAPIYTVENLIRMNFEVKPVVNFECTPTGKTSVWECKGIANVPYQVYVHTNRTDDLKVTVADAKPVFISGQGLVYRSFEAFKGSFSVKVTTVDDRPYPGVTVLVQDATNI